MASTREGRLHDDRLRFWEEAARLAGKEVDTWRDTWRNTKKDKGLSAIRWTFSPGRQYRLTIRKMDAGKNSGPRVKDLIFLRDVGVNHLFRHVGSQMMESFKDGQLVDYTIKGL